MTGHFTTDAVVLGAIDYGESDRIVTFYTLEFGKLKGIAKGAKRSKKRFAGILEPFSYIKLLFFQKPGRDLVFLEQADTIKRFDNLLLDIDRIAFGSYCLELLSEMTPEHQKNQKAFELLLKILAMLNQGADSKSTARIFEMRLLSLLGYHPYLDACVVCKHETDTKIFFSSAKSGILCPSCKEKASANRELRITNHGFIPVSQGAIKFLIQAAKSDIDKIERISMPDWASEECGKIMEDFIRYQLGKELKSKRFLRKIETTGERQ